MIRTLIKKDLKIFFYDKKGLALSFLLPIILIALFAFSFGGAGQKKSAPKPVNLLIADQDTTKTSQDFLATLASRPTLQVTQVTETDAVERIQKGKSAAVLVLKKGFEKAVETGQPLPVEFKYDAAREIQIQMMLGVVKGHMMQQYGNPEAFKNIRVQLTSLMKENEDKPNPGLIQAIGGTATMMLLFTIAAIGAGLLEEKEAGTLKRLLSTPVKPIHILLAKMSTGIIISILQLTVMFVFSWIAFDLPLFNDIVSLVILVLCISFSVSSFGVLLASLVKTRQQLQGMSTIIILLLSALGGSMIPTAMMPALLQKTAVISVNYWGIQGMFDIFWRQLPFLEIIPKMGILLGIGLIMILIAAPLFKRNIVTME